MPSRSVDIAVKVLAPAWRRTQPSVLSHVRRVVRATFDSLDLTVDTGGSPVELAVVLTGDAMVRRLNCEYRGIDKATNVLSFRGSHDGQSTAPDAPLLLGDVILAFETVADEASSQGKTLPDHASHLVVHGILHLLGHDHRTAREARIMESIEVDILSGLGIADPYRPARARQARGSAQ